MKNFTLSFLIGLAGATIVLGALDVVLTVYKNKARIQSLEAQVQSLTSTP